MPAPYLGSGLSPIDIPFYFQFGGEGSSDGRSFIRDLLTFDIIRHYMMEDSRNEEVTEGKEMCTGKRVLQHQLARQTQQTTCNGVDVGERKKKSPVSQYCSVRKERRQRTGPLSQPFLLAVVANGVRRNGHDSLSFKSFSLRHPSSVRLQTPLQK